MKKLVLFMALIILAMTGVTSASSPKVNVNGDILENTAIIKDGRTLVAVRGVFEKLGYSVEWDNSKSTAVLKNDEYTIILQNGLNYFTVNNKPVMPDVPQQIINSKFYLPLRAVGEAAGANVSWDKATETAIITTESENIIKDFEVVNMDNEQSAIKAAPGVHTIKNLLLTCLEPVGKTMYIYGGGWNEEDTGAGVEAVSIGLSSTWKEFYDKQNSSYDYSDYNYKKDVSVIHLGLDCSGYVGWAVYNTINTENNLEGYVSSSKKIASNLAAKGWGFLAPKNSFTDYLAGDIMSASCNDCAHVWICIGQCDDGSVVFVHSSPPGVQISGTYTRAGNKNSQAVTLANQYMKKYYPQWYEKYPDSSRNQSYLSHYDRFRWTDGIMLSDPDGLRNMKAEDVLKSLFNEF